MLSHYYYGQSVASSTPYADLVASLGAIAYWGFQGNANDSIGGYNLTLAGSPVYGSGPGGELTQAIDLEDTSNQWGSVNNAALRPTEALSVIAWINAETLAADKGIVGCANTGFQGYCMRAGSSNGITIEINDGASTQTVIGAAASYSAATWYFLVMTYDKANLRLYRNDATEDANSPSAATYSIGYSSNTLYVGNWDGNTTRDWDGLIAGVAVFGTALTSGNISSLYQAVMG